MKVELKEMQRAAIEHREGNLLVSASAGSGKTFVMISRAIKLIKEGAARVDEILALTFTEKAAKEMKERLSSALLEEIRKGRSDLKSQLDELATADVSTIHSFAMKLIKTYFFALEVNCDFSVCDKNEAELFKEEAMDKVFSAYYEEENGDFLDLVDKFASKRKDVELRKTVLSIYEKTDSDSDPSGILDLTVDVYSDPQSYVLKAGEEMKEELKKKLESKVKVLSELSEKSRALGYDEYVAFIDKITSAAEEVIKCENIFAAKERFGDFKIEGTVSARKKDEVSKAISSDIRKAASGIEKEIKGAFSRFSSQKEEIEGLKENASSAKMLVSLVKNFRKEYEKIKKEENKLDFCDLERNLLKLLENEEIASSIREKYKFVFVDEYQDINGVQDALIKKLTADNLFMVGDLKQSIYGFRGSNADFFKEKLNSCKKEGCKLITLNDNFRSADKILSFVNDVFCSVMTENACGYDYRSLGKFNMSGVYSAGEGRVKYHLLPVKEKKQAEEPRIYSLYEESLKNTAVRRSAEGELIARIIEDELSQEFYDIKSGAKRKVEFGDIAVLLRKGRDMAEIASTLVSYGIPVISEGNDDIRNYPEIKALMDLLRAIDNKKQDYPLVSVMKNFGHFTEDELYKIAAFSGGDKSCDYFYKAYNRYLIEGEGELKDKLVSFDGYFEDIRFKADFMSARDILAKVIFESDFDIKVSAGITGRERSARIDRFLAVASAVEGLSVREFLKRAEKSKDEFNKADSAGENAVRIMTIHKSKGLEFPVVILGGLNGKFNKSDTFGKVIMDDEYGLAINNYDKNTRTVKGNILREIIKERVTKDLVAEEMRLFYVATTRAKYSLHLLTDKIGKDLLGGNDILKASCYADFMPARFPYEECSVVEEQAEEKTSNKGVFFGEANGDLVEKVKRNLTFVYPNKVGAELPLKRTVTDVMHGGEEIEEYKILPLFSEEAGESAERGTAVHKFLEYFDFSRREEVTAQFEKMKSGGIITDKEAQLIDLKVLDNVLKHDIFSELNSFTLYREIPFILNIKAKELLGADTEDEIMLQGVIDLLAVKGENAWVIDYKYSSKGKDALIKTYLKQLQLYKAAVERTLNLKVEKTAIISLKNAEVIVL